MLNNFTTSNASGLTVIMKSALDQLDPLSCCCIRNKEEEDDHQNAVWEAYLQAAKRTADLCGENPGSMQVLLTQVLHARQFLQGQRKAGRQKGKGPWPQEVLDHDQAAIDALGDQWGIALQKEREAWLQARQE